MKRLTALVSGKVQGAGYRAKVVTIAKAFGLRGYVQNLADKRVKVVAEGTDADLERFASALVMKNSLIDVSDVERNYSSASGEYDGFVKMVDEGETDARLDKAAEYLKELIDLTKQGLNKQDQALGKMDQMLDKQDQALGKMDQMLGKQDQMLGKMDLMLDKQDRTVEKIDEAKNDMISEIKDLRSDLKTNLEDRLSRIEGDVAQIKAKIGL